MTRSSNDPVSDALGSSRRAASSSSATSGEPPDRSATSRSRLADARSPSIPSIRAASSSRSSGGMTSRSGGCGPVTIASRSADHGSYRATTSDWCGADDDQALIAGDPGEERDERPCRGVREVQVLDHEDDRVPLPEPAEQTEDALERPRLAPLRGGRARGRRSKRRSRPGAAPGRAAGGRPRTWPGRAGRPGSRRAAPGGSDRWPGRSGRRARRRGPARRQPGARSSARAGRRSGRSPRRGGGSPRSRPSRRSGPSASGRARRRRGPPRDRRTPLRAPRTARSYT